MRAGDGASKPESTETFAEGLNRPYGIAFYPPGPNPQYVYVGETNQVVRFPYKTGDLKATGKAELIVPNIPVGGGHWTRDVAFSPDSKTMYVSVGSGSNVAEDMADEAGCGSMGKGPARRLLGQGGMARRRAGLRSRRQEPAVYAHRHSQLLGLAVQPGTGTLFCATNERDALGDNLPPDYVTSVKGRRLLRLALVLHRRQ